MEYNPFARDIQTNPFPVYQWLRDEAPVYHNAEIVFYALSRFDDVLQAHLDPATFVSSHGVTIEGYDRGQDLLITRDEPGHGWHRKLVSRLFTPRAISELEPKDRGFARALVMATLRHLGPIDRTLDPCLQREPPEAVRMILRLGAESGRLVHVEQIAARTGQRAPWPEWVPAEVTARFSSVGVPTPWAHQASRGALPLAGWRGVWSGRVADGHAGAARLARGGVLAAWPLEEVSCGQRPYTV